MTDAYRCAPAAAAGVDFTFCLTCHLFLNYSTSGMVLEKRTLETVNCSSCCVLTAGVWRRCIVPCVVLTTCCQCCRCYVLCISGRVDGRLWCGSRCLYELWCSTCLISSTVYKYVYKTCVLSDGCVTQKYSLDLHQIFSAYYLHPWIGPSLMLATSGFMDDVIFAHDICCLTSPPSWSAVHMQPLAWL